MEFVKLEETEIKEAAQKAFPGFYIEVEHSDIYLRDTRAGRYRAPWLDREFYVSTDYAYEDILVNGNKTRYKVQMPCILLKKDKYDIIYDSKDKYFSVYKENDEIKFMKYIDIIELLPDDIELLEELTPV